eukprot:scaffold2706_cov109-Isochrysis_galbana.AAC.4
MPFTKAATAVAETCGQEGSNGDDSAVFSLVCDGAESRQAARASVRMKATLLETTPPRSDTVEAARPRFLGMP